MLTVRWRFVVSGCPRAPGNGDVFSHRGSCVASRRDLRPAGGVWQGVNPRSGSVASVIWVTRPTGHQAIVFIDVDGESLNADHGGEG